MMQFLTLLILGVIVFLIMRRILKNQAEKKIREQIDSYYEPQGEFKESETMDEPLNFGYKNMWFAVKADSNEEIADLLDLNILGKANWVNGMEESYNKRVFITPQVKGWKLICGWGLSKLVEGESADVKILNKLSAKYGEAHYFFNHRVNECHIWAKSENGELKRYYGWVGDIGKNIKIEGEPTEIEKDLNLVNTFLPEAENEEAYFNDESLVIPHEDMVLEIAANWSVSPMDLYKTEDADNDFGVVAVMR